MITSTPLPSDSRTHRPTNSVKVSHIAARANKREIIALFNSLIGEVCGSKEIRDCGSSALELTFASPDAAVKALCMTGYTVSGTPLNVTSVFFPGEDSTARFQKDDRRNLYVLGLPFSLTKAELSNMFACYGTVSHCVILATLDNSSRRRGFVVMSTHIEARKAMAALTCAQLSGRTLDISWAVVQRSQGFLDGGDRLMALDPRPSSRVNFRRNHYAHSPANSSDSSLDENELDYSSLVPSSLPTSVLLVSNLPTVLFSQLHDLHPLFAPFGSIKNLQIVEKSPTGSTSVIVGYATAMSAKEAKEYLTGQRYANFQVETSYIRSCPPASHTFQDPKISGPKDLDFLTFFDNPIGDPFNSALVNPCHNPKSGQYLTGFQFSRTRATPIPPQHINNHVDLFRCGSRWSSDSGSRRPESRAIGSINLSSRNYHH